MTRLGVYGVGEIGLGIARCAGAGGFEVSVWDIDTDRLTAAARMANGQFHVATSPEAAAVGTTLIVECISEDLGAKASLLRHAMNSTDAGCIFMTATSGLSITRLGRDAGCGDRVVGTHFWNPPELMPVVEVTPGEETCEKTLAAAVGFVRAVGKTPVLVRRDVPGFIGNRLLHALWREAIAMVENGVATPSDIDHVARMTFGLRMAALGPLENMDLVGLDLVQSIHEYLLPDIAHNAEPSGLLNGLVRQGHLGVKATEGFYRWEAGRAERLRARRDHIISSQLTAMREFESERPVSE